MASRVLLCLVVLGLPVEAALAQMPTGARVVGANGATGPWQARVGDRVALTVALEGRGRSLSALPPGARVRWLLVAPRMQHVALQPPNAGIQQYSNSVLFGPEHGRWIGYDTIEYETVPLEPGPGVDIDGDRVVLTAAVGQSLADTGGAGSVWVAAEVALPDGTTRRTPDGQSVDRLGLRADVARVSFRRGDAFLDWLGTYFFVPNVFGSTGPQADRYTGADCADVLVGALRASGRRAAYTSVRGIHSLARPVSSVLLMDRQGRVTGEGGQAVALRWGRDVLPGDLVAIDYVGEGELMPRAWDHVGALARDGSRDAGPDGVLDGGDLMRHMTPMGLLDLPVGLGSPIRFRLWRWR